MKDPDAPYATRRAALLVVKESEVTARRVKQKREVLKYRRNEQREGLGPTAGGRECGTKQRTHRGNVITAGVWEHSRRNRPPRICGLPSAVKVTWNAMDVRYRMPATDLTWPDVGR